METSKRWSSVREIGVAVLTGTLYLLGYNGFGLTALAWVAFAPLLTLFALKKMSVKRV